MKRISERIEKNKQSLAQTALMLFVQDRSIDPRRRFSFVPCMAPFVMGFSDVNKYGLRDDASEDPVQQLINAHTREDDHHWGMYLKDLRTLELNSSLDLNGALRMLWGEDRKKTRQTVYGLMALIEDTHPGVRMAVVEAIEATGDVAFTHFSQLADEFKESTGQELCYFGHIHKELETGHAMGTEDIEAKLEEIALSPELEQQALALVDKVFALFASMFEEWMAYAQRGTQVQVRASNLPLQVPARTQQPLSA
ncbi:hypothetical protein [Archangium lansingense]|uniref:Uncharacterized protein n=1 Tax=Archangium lansingense TaxID=2995310 RepID=A0ABT4AP76_9BACT|nr:hypothetical protein [Archangium lansinium]MCY1083513.1 hypothetical protein [Archangium lansinium]